MNVKTFEPFGSRVLFERAEVKVGSGIIIPETDQFKDALAENYGTVISVGHKADPEMNLKPGDLIQWAPNAQLTTIEVDGKRLTLIADYNIIGKITI